MTKRDTVNAATLAASALGKLAWKGVPKRERRRRMKKLLNRRWDIPDEQRSQRARQLWNQMSDRQRKARIAAMTEGRRKASRRPKS